MRQVEPRVFLVGETRIVPDGLQAYLDHIGVPDWKSKDWTKTSPSDIEKLVEVCGRLCYRSFGTGLNPNLTKVRETNRDYIKNIIKVKHGSVLEHGFVNFIFADVSRVFTHELVRHRVGTSISQESLRFVRVEDIGFWCPPLVVENDEAMTLYLQTLRDLEAVQRKLAKIFKIEDQASFHGKKRITTHMRRLLPEGLATTIAWGANIRTLRWLISMRTEPGAEEEIRLVFGKVAEILIERYPTLFDDFQKEIADGLPYYKTSSEKI